MSLERRGLFRFGMMLLSALALRPRRARAAAVELAGGDAVPDEETIYRFIERIHDLGIRRPGYPADRRAEEICLEHFRARGLEKVRLEPVELPLWEPRSWSLRARGGGTEIDLPCFPLPHSAPAPEIEAELVPFDRSAPDRVAGRISLDEVTLMRLPPRFPVDGFPDDLEADPDLALRPRPGGRVYDPEETFRGSVQILPFGPRIHGAMEPSIAAGAIGFIGVLRGYPGNSHQYYVPYDGLERPIPGVWISASDGDRLRSLLASGPVTVKLEVDSVRTPVTSHNVLGELPGRDEEMVVIGSHHDGPWTSAVEDASGVALVLAQATYWSSLPREARPHRLVFDVQAGHMVGGAGARGFLRDHAAELERIVLEVHLEHTAREFVERDGRPVASGLPEPRWWFTSRIPALEDAVWSAIQAENLTRSLVIPPDVFAPVPTTDGGAFHLAGVPLVNSLTAPFYLFDKSDQLDKIDRASLVPVTRAAARIIHSTRDISATGMRAKSPLPLGEG